MFGLSAIPLFGLLGMAVDFSRVAGARYKVQDAVDSAMLAAGRAAQITLNDPATAAKNAAEAYFATAVPPDIIITESEVTINATSTELTMRVTYWVRTPIVSILAIGSSEGPPPAAPVDCKSTKFACQRLTTSATAIIMSGGNGGSNVEVAMMLDITGSMLDGDGKGSTKIATLKSAAKDAVDILIWQDQSQFTSRVALAPFSISVNVGSYARAVTGLNATSGSQRLRPCVIERLGPNAATDAVPSAANGWIGSFAATNAPSGFSYSGRLGTSNYNSAGTCGSSDPGATEAIIPLTSDKSVLKNRIDALTPTGGTAGHLGTAWAWYLLSPNWSTIWPTASRPGPYSDITTINAKGYPALQKYAILMTDGEYNTQYSSRTSQAQASTLCTNMKAQGITVFTVGFMVNSTSRTHLTACATSPDHFYNATDGEKLKAAFRDIALKISSLRLSL
jgi:Flp pilus assembly protein TadG